MLRSFFLVCLTVSSVFAIEDSAHLKSWASEILSQQPDSILFCTETKVYLRPEKIHTTARGIVLGDQFSMIDLPFLFADEAGCYLPTLSKPNSEYTGYWICQNSECANFKRIWRSKSNRCPTCHKPGDPA